MPFFHTISHKTSLFSFFFQNSSHFTDFSKAHRLVLYPVKTPVEGKKKKTQEVDMVAKIFDEIAPKYVNRNGGYTRIVKIGQRKGDAAMEVVLELV